MKLPFNNRIRAEYRVPSEIVERSPISVNEMNRQMMVRIAEELIKSKPDIIEQTTDATGTMLHYHRMTAEVFVFTREELDSLIMQVHMDTIEGRFYK